MKNKHLLFFALGAAVGFCIPFLISSQSVSDDEHPRTEVPAAVSSPRVPTSVEFAGQTVDLKRADLHERMDREMLAFTYSHQLTLLML